MIDSMLEDIFKKRRSVRIYTKEKPKREVIRKIISTANYAPNSCNLQHFSYIYIDDNVILDKLSKIATGKVNWAPALIIVIDDSRFSNIRNAGLQSVSAANENIILSAVENGLGTCWLAGFSGDDDIKKLLNIPPYFNITALICIGYEDQDNYLDNKYRAVKIDPDSYIHFNSFLDDKIRLDTSLNVEDWSIKNVISYRDRIGSVYAPRGRIQLFNKDMIRKCSRLCSDFMSELFLQNNIDYLDFYTYDACLLKNIIEDKKCNKLNITCSDYSLFFNEINRELAKDIKIVDIGKINEKDKNKFDFISLVFKLEFLPDISDHISIVNDLLCENGYVFISSISKYSLRSISYRINSVLTKVNVYENNPLYKFGPYRFVSNKHLEKMLTDKGFSIKHKGVNDRFGKNEFYWWLVQKGNN